MMSGYRVNLEEMGVLIQSLDTSAGRMTSANGKLRESTPVGMGSADIDSAGGEFQDRWEYGIDKIAEFTEAVTEALGGARKAYAEWEDNVKRMLDEQTGAITGGAADAAAQGSGQSRIEQGLEGGPNPGTAPEPGGQSTIARGLEG